jgi:hypothetical protein
MDNARITCSYLLLDDGASNWCQLEVSGASTTLTGTNPLGISTDIEASQHLKVQKSIAAGSSLPMYAFSVSGWSHLGFNMYLDGGSYKYGTGSSGAYAAMFAFNFSNGMLGLHGATTSGDGGNTVPSYSKWLSVDTTVGEIGVGMDPVSGCRFSVNGDLRVVGGSVSVSELTSTGSITLSPSGTLTVTSGVLFDEGSESVVNVFSSNSTGNYPYYNLLKKISTGTVMLNYHIIGKLQFAGYYSAVNARTGGNIECIATENWSGSNGGCEVNISATKNGSTALTPMFKAGSDGYGHVAVYDHNTGDHRLQRIETGIIDTSTTSTPHTIYFNKVFSASPKVFIHGQAVAGAFGSYQTDSVTTSEVAFAWASVPGGTKLSWMAIGY